MFIANGKTKIELITLILAVYLTRKSIFPLQEKIRNSQFFYRIDLKIRAKVNNIRIHFSLFAVHLKRHS